MGKSHVDFALDQSAAAILNSIAKGRGSNPFWTKPEVVLLGPASLYASGDADARRHFPGATHHPGCEQRPCVLGPGKHRALDARNSQRKG